MKLFPRRRGGDFGLVLALLHGQADRHVARGLDVLLRRVEEGLVGISRLPKPLPEHHHAVVHQNEVTAIVALGLEELDEAVE